MTGGSTFRLEVEPKILKNTIVTFKDGCTISYHGTSITTASISTNLTIQQIEHIYTDSMRNQLDYYNINKTTLVLTNARYYFLYNSDDLVTVFLGRFHSIEKMNTLRLTIGGESVNLRKSMDKISMAPDFSQFFTDILSIQKN
uniref:Uncharacterized protein n=1 Tax=Romanomermis culicivorax TaxID=13658 RepID=A0A915JJW6_ROMCU